MSNFPDFHGLTYDEFCACVSDKNPDENKRNIFPNGISDVLALQILLDHFIEPEYYISYSCGKYQANTEMVGEILRRFPAGKVKRIPKFSSKRIKEENFQRFFDEDRLN